MEDIDIGQVILYSPCWRCTEGPTRAGERCARADDIGAAEHESVDEQCVGDGETGKLAGFARMLFRRRGFGSHDGDSDDHSEEGQRGAEVRSDDGWRQLPEDGEAAEYDLDDQQDGGKNKRGYENLSLVARPAVGADGQCNDKHADDGGDEAVKLFKERVIVYGGKGLTIAEGPVGAAQTGVCGAYSAAEGDKKICESDRYPGYAAYKFHANAPNILFGKIV